MNPFEATAIFVGELVAIVLIALAFHERGRRGGIKKGYLAGYGEGFAAGRKQADNWWIGLETEADKVRQQIWREEAQP
jgi:hypothetical protein